MIDLAARAFGGAVVAANDETFAEKENLIRPDAPLFRPATFGHKGQVYDGWETRRRRSPGHDWVIVRLGAPGIVREVVVDTAHFTGNYPEECWLEGLYVDGYPDVTTATGWVPLTGREALKGNSANAFDVADGPLVTHVRLNISPDGGVARLRVLGEVVPDPRRLEGLTLDLAALENGGRVEDSSNRFYSPADNVLLPGLAQTMGQGWETRRRRGEGNDWLLIRLAGAGHVRQLVVDTTHFVGNAPGEVRVQGVHDGTWFDLVERRPLLPDTPHWFATDPSRPTTHLRVDVFPDGGLARVRAFGSLTPDAWDALVARWEGVRAAP
ncbi:allantoicase [Cryptosporangium phraense]|uniref:Probable allantoicase n=1 Tax=Cryptosporangium phraense TaxID=2593070 RepID=A0A545AQM2_9ACTN|nr:allantoicase [Cryptosporangium phraense]TQS43541.1 allantoicase [Cryptosporangium phraense]